MLTFDDYKAKISIIQILEDLGYKQDISKGKVSPVFKLTDGAGNKLDEIIIKNPHSVQEHYYDRNYKGGDLIQFIKNHINDFPQFQHQNTFVRINMILGHYANEPYSPKYEAFKVVKAENKSFDRDRYKEFPTTLADLRFLTNERNINHQVVEKFLPFITRVKDLQGNGNYYNIGFPYINPKDKDNKVTNYELRNYGFKGMAAGGDKSNSLWIADFCPHPQMAKHIYFAESALDAMSFYQLNANKIKLEESVFCSVGGYISVNQIKNTLLRYPQAKVHTCFDNDLNGNLYDIKVSGIISNTEMTVKENKDDMLFKTKGREFTINKNDVSLESFREKSKIIAPMISHKAEKAKDFNEILMKQHEQKKSIKL